MTLLQDVAADLRQLAPRGWKTLLARHGGLDIEAADLDKELRRTLSVDRDIPGFKDFSKLGKRAVEPGDPAVSLLYHAFASPNVHPTADGSPGAPADYPTLEQIDRLENLIYSLARDTIDAGALVPAVFAYEYRPAGRTPHKLHADLVFSRTGITRNGTQPSSYDPVLRSFAWCDQARKEPRVLPARYGVFLARRVYGKADTNEQVREFSLLGIRYRGDADRDFLIPVHKLFDGAECVRNATNLKLGFRHRHVSEKLARACRAGGLNASGADLTRAPFVIVSDDAAGHIKLASHGASRTVEPDAAPLIAPAIQDGKPMSFTVPAKTPVGLVNRQHTSLRLYDDLGALALEGIESLLENVLNWLAPRSRFPRPRNAPEFVNIRHVKNPDGTVQDMHDWPRPEFEKVNAGGYQAMFFTDNCADGCVSANFADVADNGISAHLANAGLQPVRPAFSVVAPPDFFPSLDQMELWEWMRDKFEVRSQFRQGGPEPLCHGRLPPNPATVDPFTNESAFLRKDEKTDHGAETLLAVVSRLPRVSGKVNKLETADNDERANFLPDAASNVFAPGWDVTYASNDDIAAFYATYGLGSPFPEDVKLCAAANSFWPAVSPDAARTFGITATPTAMPLTDKELGYHAHHPWVGNKVAQATRGWDGEQGCFLEKNGQVVNVVDIDRSDYVSNVLAGRVSFTLLGGITATEMFRRMKALRDCIAKIDPGEDPAETDYLLVSMEPADWATVVGSGLTGKGYRLIFAKLDDEQDAEPELDRRRYTIEDNVFRCRWADKAVKVDKAAPGQGAVALYGL